jgi:hypothetical protein
MNYNATMTELADAIRAKSGAEGKLTVPQMIDAVNNIEPGGGSVDVTLGQVNAEGNFQPLAFNGIDASNSGNPETVENYYGFNGVLPVPESGGGGSSMDFYKCASVDTVNKTWTGYLAVCDADGVYTFEETATTGLTYGTAYKPIADNVYNADATIQIMKLWNGSLFPVDGLVFYASLAEAKETAETGQSLAVTGTVEYTTMQGIPCVSLNGASDIHMTAYSGEIPQGSEPRTTSVWMHATETGWGWAVGYGNPGTSGGGEIIGVTSDGYVSYSQRPDIIDSSSSVLYTWVHIAAVCDGATKKLYVNGEFRASASTQGTVSNRYGVYIGSTCGVEFLTGYVSSVRVYNRVLDDGEIALLASEFTPTA